MQAGAVSTVAGNGTAAVRDGTGTGAELYSPSGMSIAGGSGYFYDNGYFRKVVLATGVVSTVSGDGSGTCTDSSTSSATKVGNPWGNIANDGSFLYWFDSNCGLGSGQGVLRRMSLTTGAVSHVPGNIYGMYLTVGPGGVLYATSNGNVSKINTDTGAATALATPTQTINSTTYSDDIRGITADATSVWVTGSYDYNPNNGNTYNAVSQIDVATGNVTTIYNGYPAISPIINGPLVSAGNYLYVTAGNQLFQLAKAGGAPAVLAGSTTAGFSDGYGTGAKFSTIEGIDVDGSSVWISDTGNHLIRRVIAAPPGAPTASFPTAGVSPVEVPGASNASEACACSQGQATGNPVNTNTGAFWHSFTDLTTPGRGPGLGISRTYVSSGGAQDSAFGHGWSFSYGLSLTTDSVNGNVTVHQEDGSQVAFVPGTTSGSFTPIQPRILATLKQSSDGSFTFVRRARVICRFTSAGLLKSIADLNGNRTILTYDGNGNLSKATDATGRAYTVTVDGNGHVTKVTDSKSRSYTYGYSAAGDLTSVTDPTNAVWTFTYDGNHQLLTMLDPNQQGASTPHPLTNVYDTQGRVSKQTDFAGRVTTFDYTSIAGATKITDPAGHVTVDYYSNGLRSKSSTGYGTSAAASVSYTYDPATEAVASVTDPLNHVTSDTYDSAGNTLTTTDPLHHTTTNTFDGLNDPLTSADPAGTTTTRSYDSAGNLLTVSTPVENSSGTVVATQKTTYHRDDATHPDDVTSIVSPNGNTTTYTHDSAGNLTAITAPPTPENVAGNKTSYSYDPATGWRLTATTPRGNLAGATAATYTTSYAYDTDGRPTRVRGGLWTSTSPTQHQVLMAYDQDGNLTSRTDGTGSSTGYVFDADNELITTNLPTGTATHQSWTPDGRLSTSTDAAGHVTTNGYDTQNRLTTVKDPLNHTTTYSYDSAGNLTLRAAPGATCTGSTPTAGCAKYVYDAGNELTARTYLDSGTPAVTAISYDADGRRTTETDPSGTSTTTYDNLGRVTAYQNGYGTTTSYTYDLDDNTLTVTYPGSGHTVTRSYDAVDRPAATSDWLSNTATFAYDANSNPVTATFPAGSGETDTTTYSSIDTVTGIADTRTAGGTTTTLAAFTYTRDGANQLKTSTTTGISEAAQNYSHDSLGRLTASGSSSTPTSYTYSPSDDPTNRGTTSGGAASTQAFNAGDQLCWSTPTTVASPDCGTVPSGASTYTYDTNGNRLTSKVGSAAATSYAYNEAQQLTGYTTPTGTATTYTYNADGLRQTKTTGTTTTRFTWDPTTANAQLLSDATNYYVYDNTGSPLEQISSTGTVTWLHHDQFGSTRLLTNTTGTNVGTTTYDPYGSKTASSGTVTTPLGYNGQYTDPESGLVYLRARYYDPATAQFLTLDLLRAATGEPYAYTHDNPTDRSDPSGLCDGFWKCAYSGLEGFTNGVTFGGVGALDEALSRGSTCTYDHGALYTTSYIGGQVFDAIATDGGSAEVQATEEATAAATADSVGMAGVRAAGQTGEDLAGIVKNTGRIPSASGTAAYRIPDELNAATLGEVKNVSRLSYTNQLRDFSSYAQSTERAFNLYVRGSTTFTPPLQNAIDAGLINVVRNLPG